MADDLNRVRPRGRARHLAAVVCMGLALAAASCDSEVEPSDPTAWMLAPCIEAPGVAVLIFGQYDLACVSEAGTFETTLNTLLTPGGDYYLHGSGPEVVLSMMNFNLNTISLRLDLLTGDLETLSPREATTSQIARVGYTGDRYLVTDVYPSVASDTTRFEFSFVDGEDIATTLTLNVPDIGFAFLNDVAYHEPTNTSIHVFVASRLSGESGRYEMLVDHDLGTYRFLDSDGFLFDGAQFLPSGELVVSDNVAERLYLADGAFEPVRDADGSPLRTAPPRLAQDGRGDVYTFTREDAGSRVLRVLPGGTVEEVFRLDRPQSAIYASPSADVLCLREHRPFLYEEETFDDIVTIYSLADGSVTQYETTLNTEDYNVQRVACL